VSGKNTIAGSPVLLSVKSVKEGPGQEMAEGEINEVAKEEVVIEDTEYAKVRNKVVEPKKSVAGETGSEPSPDDELRAQFGTARYRKKQRNLQTIA
jgi:hypothetical protein